MAEEEREEKKIGEVTHYFDNIQVAIVRLEAPLRKGDKVRFKGHTTDFEETVDSMQVDHADIEEAGEGDEIGVNVTDRVREGDEVYKV
jgi:putative protease